jgi:SAM-dependent methyltransferase
MRDEVLKFVDVTLEWYAKDTGSKPGTVLDIGSYDVNGSARSNFEKTGWTYTGFDMEKGPNVDVVGCADDLSKYFPPAFFGAVSCLDTLEHVIDPMLVARQCLWALKPGGLLILSAAGNGFPLHRHPIDCWRVLPDGMAHMMRGCRNIEIYLFNEMAGIVSRGIKETA